VSLGDSRISAEIGAPVAEIPARVGDIFEAGETLVRLECADYRLAVAELQAMLAGTKARIDFSRSQLERVRSLKAKQTVSEEVFEQRESELAGLVAERDMKQAQLDKARRSVDKCELRAPFRAAVVERVASVGEYAMPGSPLLRVLDVGNLEVSAHLIVGDAEALLHAERVTFRHGGGDYPVAVRALGPQIDPVRRTREVRLVFEGEQALPGATGRLVWSTGSMLPADLLVRRDDQLGVMLAADGLARF
jgi:RND family efflux transporter MFP subunit